MRSAAHLAQHEGSQEARHGDQPRKGVRLGGPSDLQLGLPLRKIIGN
jgi:hypothetical protein